MYISLEFTYLFLLYNWRRLWYKCTGVLMTVGCLAYELHARLET